MSLGQALFGASFVSVLILVGLLGPTSEVRDASRSVAAVVFVFLVIVGIYQ